MSLLPTDLFEELLIRLPIITLLRIVPYNRELLKRASRPSYWNRYFTRRDEPQEYFHRSLIELARNGYGTIFSQLWKENKIKLIKEGRTLVAGYEVAALAGRESSAEEIFMLKEEWMTEQFDSFNPNVDDFTEKFEWIERAMRVRREATTNNLPTFLLMLGKISLFCINNSLTTDYVMSYLSDILFASFADSNDYEFVTGVLHWLDGSEISNLIVNTTSINYTLLGRGRYELLNQLISGGYLIENTIDWSIMINSDRHDLLELLESAGQLNELKHGVIGEFRDPNLLNWYVRYHPKDLETILNSYRALPADQFLALVLRTLKCVPKDIHRYIKMWKILGYDYLAHRFLQVVPMC